MNEQALPSALGSELGTAREEPNRGIRGQIEESAHQANATQGTAPMSDTFDAVETYSEVELLDTLHKSVRQARGIAHQLESNQQIEAVDRDAAWACCACLDRAHEALQQLADLRNGRHGESPLGEEL